MQSEIETLLLDLMLLAGGVEEAVGQAKSFRFNCRMMGKQMYQLSHMVERLFCLITLDPFLLCLNPIHCVISELGNEHQEMVIETVVALTKFVCEDNHLHKAHSKRMIEFNVVQALVKLLRNGGRRQQLHGLVLICYLAMNADDSEAMEQARVVIAIQQSLTTKREHRRVVSQNPQLKELVPKALQNRTILYYQY
ncbi:hypothetical protein REPUB_Repub01dG0167400 [Reevesia pubescens]